VWTVCNIGWPDHGVAGYCVLCGDRRAFALWSGNRFMSGLAVTRVGLAIRSQWKVLHDPVNWLHTRFTQWAGYRSGEDELSRSKISGEKKFWKLGILLNPVERSLHWGKQLTGSPVSSQDVSEQTYLRGTERNGHFDDYFESECTTWTFKCGCRNGKTVD